MMGLQFENLVLNNGLLICKLLRISPEEIVIANPYFQRATARKKGCQIDYLIQTRFGGLYVCEVKFQQSCVGTEVIDEVKEKIDHLQMPRGFSCRPVLIHVNGVSEQVADCGFFARIIDFSELLK